MGRMYRIGVGDPERTILLRSRCFRSLALILGAVAALVALAACSDDTPPAAAPTPDIEAMVEARVQATLAAVPMPTLTPTHDIEGIIGPRGLGCNTYTCTHPRPIAIANACVNGCHRPIALAHTHAYDYPMALANA